MTYYEYFMPHDGLEWFMAIFLLVWICTIGWRMALVFIGVIYLCVVESRDWICERVTRRAREQIAKSLESRRKGMLTMPRIRFLRGEKKIKKRIPQRHRTILQLTAREGGNRRSQG